MKKALMIMLAGSFAFAGYAQEGEKSLWADTITLKGDLRARFESIDEEDKDTRDRARYRARVGAYAEINDEVDAAIALASGEDDPVSTNQTLDDGFSSKPVRIDLAYIDLHPSLLGGQNVVLGKMKMPFIAVNDLIWDTDLNPEGAALKTSIGDDELSFNFNAGTFWVDERSRDSETMLNGAQLAANTKAGGLKLTAGASYYLYDNVAGNTPIFDPTDSFGNTVIETPAADPSADPSLEYAYDYELVEFFTRIGFELGLPIELSASHVANQEVDVDDQGYMFGVKAGKLKDPGSFELGYSFKELEADAVLGVFADSDSFGGGTDGNAHKLSLAYQIARNLSGHVTYSICEKGLDDGKDYNRLQVDLTVKF